MASTTPVDPLHPLQTSQRQEEQPKPAQPGLFQCSQCQRTFTRVDHLTRHVRSHLQERPYQCQTCEKSFGRPDLLKRHMLSHQAVDENGKKRRKRRTTQMRVLRACRACAVAKLKCDDHSPCTRCTQKSLTCHRDLPNDRKPQANAPPVSERSPSSCSNDEDSPMVGSQDSIEVATTNASHHGDLLPTPAPTTDDQSSIHPHLQTHPSFSFSDHDMTGFLKEAMAPSFGHSRRPCSPGVNWMEMDTDFAPRGLLDFTTDSSIEFNQADMDVFEQLFDSNWNFETHPPPDHRTESIGSSGGHLGLGADAYKRSPLGPWEPSRQHDYVAAELDNLSVLGSGVETPSTPLAEGGRFCGEVLGRPARDEVLAMLLESCGSHRKSIVIKAFPSPEFLNDLIQCFYWNHSRQVDSFIHIPTFRPNHQRAELLCACIATGAIMTDMRSLHKLGFAMQEAARTTLPSRFEEENATTRALWAVQAMMCEIDIGLWSGIKRKMEIAESHPQIVYTMLRRAKRFRGPKKDLEPPNEHDTGDTLHRKWLAWVEEESYRRLAYHAFLTDAQSSMAMGTNPVISYAEMSTPLPESRELWFAEDAEQWKSVYLRKPRTQSPLSLVDYLRRTVEIPEYHDLQFSQVIILHGIWGLIWQHRQLESTLQTAGQGHAAITLLRQEVIQALQRFQVHFLGGGQDDLCPNACLLLELLHMYVHVSLDDVEYFAGKGDIEDARQVLPALQRWVAGSDARQAIWHAGQVVRAAKGFPPKRLRGFLTVAVYQATLVMWAYSIVSAAEGVGAGVNATAPSPQHAHPHAQNNNPPPSSHAIVLDGLDSSAVQRFITLGKGTPSITGPPGLEFAAPDLVPLSDQEAAIGATLEMLASNFSCQLEGDAPPPLVENLMQLLGDLSRAAANIGC
ncbi:c6 zinc finger domain-containing protein [Xylariaceae sp. FL0016]|nr:c6 zinc finger domain-containing protein [Xylariaceae sp. FL0016]